MTPPAIRVFRAASEINAGRRMFLTCAVAGLATVILSTVPGSAAGITPTGAGKKMLIVYFSHSGNTRAVAEQIRAATGGELLELRPAAPYPETYDDVVEQAKKEVRSGYTPPLRTKMPDISTYDVIFVGSPNWWGTIAPPVRTFLTENDLAGKTVAPFITHEGSRLGRAVEDIRSLCPQAVVTPGLAVRGSAASSARAETEAWLRSNDPAK